MQIRTKSDVKSLGSILGIWAHPDDDVFSMGMIMAAAAENGQRAECIIATRGELGIQDESRWPANKLAQIRTSELTAAYEELGHLHCHWLDYPDGGCSDVDQDEALKVVSRIIQSFSPDTILTFGPDGMTGHPDHQKVSAWASEAAKLAGSDARIFHVTHTKDQLKTLEEADKANNIFFNTNKPPLTEDEQCDILFSDPDLIHKKIKALEAMPSQTEKLLAGYGDDCARAFGVEAFVEWK